MFDPESVRPLFPALAQPVNGLPAIFFDAPGGTQVPQPVLNAMHNYLIQSNANAGGAFLTSQRSDAILKIAHTAVADLLNCAPDEVIFGANMTTLTFAMSRAIGRTLQAGDEIIVTRLDHDANVAPWQALAEQGAVIRTVDIDVEDCTLDMADFTAQLNERTRLIAVGYASNAVGTINDIPAIVRLARQVGAWVYVDAVHYAPHGLIDVRALDCDFLACSAYKFFAPHIGCVYGKREHLQALQPYKVRPAKDAVPYRWETGTLNHEGIAGTTAAIDYLAHLVPPPHRSRRAALAATWQLLTAYERQLSEHLIRGLLALPGLTFYGIREPERFAQRTPTVAFRLDQASPRQIAEHLAQHGIFTWDGNYYALSLTERLGVEQSGGMLRVGLAHYNTHEEIDALLHALRQLTG
ncbi:MAG: cysteine desulfurase-like protein [Chloroflexaceae bacterium]|nr:cysteine desulfurase-like protein [Chloroflexaceae bacterium]